MAETRKAAHQTFDRMLQHFSAKYRQELGCLDKYREELLAFYDFPAEH